jgi:hypothetical protein
VRECPHPGCMSLSCQSPIGRTIEISTIPR